MLTVSTVNVIRFGDSLKAAKIPSVISAFNKTYPPLTPRWARMELDSHANMIVLGRTCHLSTAPGSKGYATVKSFNPDAASIEIPMVDAEVAWLDPTTSFIHLLKFENVLYVDTMDHHLISLFILREAGYTVNDTARIHTNLENLDNYTHCIVGNESERPIRIPLELKGVFSFFDVAIPDPKDYLVPEERIHVMTPNYE